MPRPVLTASGSLFEDVDERNEELIKEFGERRARNRQQDRMLQRMGSFAGMSMGGDVLAAIPRYYSPEEYFVQSQIPYKIQDDRQRIELYKWLDLFYRTHTLIPILVDIFTRFPLVGMELDCEDDDLTEFYEQVFFDDLDYEQFLVDLGREYWTLGESWPLGHFSESLGVWEEEELLDPALIEVKKFPIIGTQQFYLLPPPDLAEIAKRRQPEPLYHLLRENHEDLIPFLLSGKPIPVSDVLLKQVAFKASRRDLHGTPLLLRCLRQLIHEEKLMASQDAIAERLYSPLLLVKLGVQDMGPNRGPWIPGPDAVASLRNDLDIALASDMRLMVHHFGIEVQNVWGREQMPRLDMDFDRIERKLMQTFGVNPNLLAGGASAQPYASSALQAEFLNQILRTYQRYLKRHYESRASIVAEAQEHYAYEKRGQTRIPIMEEVIRYDDEGNEYIEERKKLMYPDLKMKVLDLRDEATQRQFLQVLKQAGVPVPDTDLAMGMGYDFTEALAKMEEELIQKTVAQQDAKVKTYDILSARGLPIPPDLQAEIEGQGQGMQGAAPGAGAGGSLDMGGDIPGGGDSIPMPQPPGGGMGGPGMPPAMGPYGPGRGMVPEQSFERSPLTGPGAMMSPGMGSPPQGLIAPAAPGRMSKVSSDGQKVYGERHAAGGGMPRRHAHDLTDVIDAQKDLLNKYKNALTEEELAATIEEHDNAED